MKDLPPSNNMENEFERKSFENELVFLENLYPKEIINAVKKNIDTLLVNYIAWQNSLVNMANRLEIKNTEVKEIPRLLEQKTFNEVENWLKENPKDKIILGISGPGAVGKEVIEKGLGFEKIINTTTRLQRDYEKQDQHYHFVDDSKFGRMLSKDVFILNTERSGRGKYGIQKEDIDKVLLKSKVAITEESPDNLIKLKKYIKTHENCNFVLIYILPPSPIMPHLAARLASRCQKTNEDFKSTISSTLGTRQLDGFNSILDFIKNEDTQIVFVVNDDIERAINRIRNLTEFK